MFKLKRAQPEEPRHHVAAEPVEPLDDVVPEDHVVTTPASGLKSKVAPSLSPKRRATPAPDGATIRQQFEAVRRYAAEPSAGIALRPHSAAAEEPSRLLIGRDITFKGEIGDCETLIVEGKIAANAKCKTLQVQEAGVYEGELNCETAEVCGRVEGRVQVRGRLTIRTAGVVDGDVTFGELDIAAGGRLTGTVRHEPIVEEAAEPAIATVAATAEAPENTASTAGDDTVITAADTTDAVDTGTEAVAAVDVPEVAKVDAPDADPQAPADTEAQATTDTDAQPPVPASDPTPEVGTADTEPFVAKHTTAKSAATKARTPKSDAAEPAGAKLPGAKLADAKPITSMVNPFKPVTEPAAAEAQEAPEANEATETDEETVPFTVGTAGERP